MYIEEFKKMVEDRLTKLHDDNSKIEFLTERLEWLGGYQNVLEVILESEYLRIENIWLRVIEPDLYLHGEDYNAHRDDELYAGAYDKVVNKLVLGYNKDGQLDFLKKLKDRVIEPVFLHQTTEWTNIEKGVQNRLKEVQALQKTTDHLKHTIKKHEDSDLETEKVGQVEDEKQLKSTEKSSEKLPQKEASEVGKKEENIDTSEGKKPFKLKTLKQEYENKCKAIFPNKEKPTQDKFAQLMEVTLKDKYKTLPPDIVKEWTFGNVTFTNASQNMSRYLKKEGTTDKNKFREENPQFSKYRAL